MKTKLKIFWFLVPWTLLGFWSKNYSGPLDFWVNNSLGGLFYVVFWVLVLQLTLFIFHKEGSHLFLVICVLGTTSLLEFLQLVKWSWLQQIRSYYLGRIVIGNTFTPSDFIYYFLGAGLSLWLLKILAKD